MLKSSRSSYTKPAVQSSLWALCVLLSGASGLVAQTTTAYLAPGRPDGILLLAPPPVAGSPEDTADLACARAVFKGRTPQEGDRAVKHASLAFPIFAPAIGPAFDLPQLPRTEALLQQVKKEVGPIIDHAKNHWKRQRPYQMDPALNFGKPEASTSYPSGHSTRGTVYALVLAEIFSEKKEAILEIGREIGWDRVLIGKHYPTDVYAGRVLGQAIVRELKDSPSFRRDLELARAEVKNLKPAPTVRALDKVEAGK